MNRHHETSRMALPPPARQPGRRSAAPGATHSSSPSAYVGRIALIAVLFTTTAVLVLLSPLVLLAPGLIRVAIVAGLVASALLAVGAGWSQRRRDGNRWRRTDPPGGPRPRPLRSTTYERRSHPRAGAAEGRVLVALAAVSASLLLLAPFLTERVGGILAAAGLAGLAALRRLMAAGQRDSPGTDAAAGQQH